MTKVILIDDEKPARDRLRLLLGELDSNIRILDEAANGKQAVEKIRSMKPDLVFLDIQMPVLDGFDVVDLLGDDLPAIVFVTAYDDYAIRAFEIHAVDYLLKPVRKERLKEAVQRADRRSNEPAQTGAIQTLMEHHISGLYGGFQKIPVNYKQEIHLLEHEEILYFEADGKLTRAVTSRKKYRTDFTLTELEKRLQHLPFLRVHRSTIVNLNAVKKLEPWFNEGYRLVLANGIELDIARRRVAELKKVLGI